MKKVGQSKKKINFTKHSPHLKSTKNKVEQDNKKKGLPNWLESLVDEIYSFTNLEPFKDRIFLSRDVNQRLITALRILLELLAVYGLDNREDSIQLRKCKWLYEKIMNQPFPLVQYELPQDFPSLCNIYASDGIRLLKIFYENQKPKHYAAAVKFGLFEELCFEANMLNFHFENSSNVEHVSQEIKDFVSLVNCALFPIVKWRYLAAENDDAKIYLQKIGESLNPGARGRKAKQPLRGSSKFLHLYNAIVCVLYGQILREFQKASELKNPAAKNLSLKDGLAGLISSQKDWSFSDAPNKDAKKFLCNLFGWNDESTLNKILGKRNDLLDELKSLKERIKQQLGL